ncbi:MAG: sugar phosphate isomerase/epimerase [Acidobacteriota bacterium]|nr:sugar phosphate isomerase/epimerase [Acidobacteriota bacterium]
MKFGINTFLWTANFGSGDFALLPGIKSHGFDGIEVTLVRPEQFEATSIRRALDENGLTCTVCSVLPSGLSLIADNAGTRAKTVEHLAECVRKTAEVEAGLIAGPLYSTVGLLPGRRRNSEEWKRAVEAYRQLGPILDECSVDLCIEPLNRFETYFLNTTEDAVALCREVDHKRVGLLWDTFHANIEEKHLAESLLLAAPYLKHVHTCENDRGTPGTGHVDWPGVFGALSKAKYQGWLTIESFGFSSGDLSAAASIWRDLASSPEQIAWQGIEFLKAQERLAERA